MDECNDVPLNSSGTFGTSLDFDYISREYDITATIYLVIVDLLIIIGNSWIMYKIVSTFRKSMYLLASLVVSDLLTGLTSIPLYLLWIHNKELFVSAKMCFGTLMVSLFLSVASILNIIAMTTERYIAICFPLFHRSNIMVRHKIIKSLAILIVWLSSIVITLSSLHFMKKDYSVCSYYNVFKGNFLIWALVLGVFGPLCILSVMYMKMLTAVKRCFKRERSIASLKSDRFNERSVFERQTSSKTYSEQPIRVPKRRLSSLSSVVRKISIASLRSDSFDGRPIFERQTSKKIHSEQGERKRSIASLKSYRFDERPAFERQTSTKLSSEQPIRVPKTRPSSLSSVERRRSIVSLRSDRFDEKPVFGRQTSIEIYSEQPLRVPKRRLSRLSSVEGKRSIASLRSDRFDEGPVFERKISTKTYSEQPLRVPKTSLSSQSSVERERGINKSLKKMITTLSLVLTCFIVCWGPFFVMIFLRLVCSNCRLPLLSYEVILLLGLSNSLANPVIYCLRHKSFRPVQIQRKSTRRRYSTRNSSSC